jgi:CHAT domain
VTGDRLFRLDSDPAGPPDLALESVLSRARDRLAAHPGFELLHIGKAPTGLDIAVRVSPGLDDDVVTGALWHALGIPAGQGWRLRRIERPDLSPGSGYAYSWASTPPGPRGVRSAPRLRYLRGECPQTVRVGRKFSLLVRISESPGGRQLNSFHVPPGGLSVAIIVHAPGLRLLDGEEQALRVPAEGDSEWIRFELAASAPGPQRISVTAWHGGTFLGEMPVEVSAELDARNDSLQEHSAELAREIVDGAVTLEVIYERAANAYRFRFHDVDNPREELQPLTYEPGPLVEQLVSQLNELAAGGLGYSAAETRDYLMDEGARLWRSLLPQRLREQFWERQHRIRQLTIMSDRDAVPWELLYPRDRRREAGFLVEQFPVTRDLFERPRLVRALRLHPARFVRSNDALSSADAEIATLTTLLGVPPSPDSIVSEFSSLRRLMQRGGFGLLHFACHSSFSPGSNGSSIDLGNRPFTVTNLESARADMALRPATPLIFLNACRTASSHATYNGLDSWAQAFMQAGAGAFIGSLWAVTDEAAQQFAAEFYRHFQAGRPLGEAMAAARNAAAREAGDPSWLAYTVYGDPHAVVTRPPGHPPESLAGGEHADR